MAQPEGPIPSLDLRALSTIELHRPTRAVLDVLVEGIDVVPSGDGDPAAGVCTRWCDDEDTARSAFTFGPPGLTAHAARSMGARRAGLCVHGVGASPSVEVRHHVRAAVNPSRTAPAPTVTTEERDTWSGIR